MVAKKLQGLDVSGIALYDPFHKLDLDIEVPRLPAIHLLSGTALFRHTTIGLFPSGIIKSRVCRSLRHISVLLNEQDICHGIQKLRKLPAFPATFRTGHCNSSRAIGRISAKVAAHETLP